MKIVIFTVTRGAKMVGLRIKEHYPEAILYTMAEFTTTGGETLPIEEPLRELVKKEFKQGKLLIFIMATGIVVRMIAPHLQHKGSDPAILVMDEAGRNIISLLSGHMGGANDWTMKLASLLGANPVITTASDVKGLVSIDLFAKNHHCRLTDWKKTKVITAHLVNGGTVGVYSEIDLGELPEGYDLGATREELNKYAYGLIISNRVIPLEENRLQIYPQNLVVGIGCRRDTPLQHIMEEIHQTFQETGLSTSSISKLATVDVKKDEVGLQEAAEVFGVPLEIISRQRIKEVEDSFETSGFVRQTIGVGAVSGPCSFLGSNRGNLILEKRKNRGITLSIAEIKKG